VLDVWPDVSAWELLQSHRVQPGAVMLGSSSEERPAVQLIEFSQRVSRRSFVTDAEGWKCDLAEAKIIDEYWLRRNPSSFKRSSAAGYVQHLEMRISHRKNSSAESY
jgi:hypothetical protein